MFKSKAAMLCMALCVMLASCQKETLTTTTNGAIASEALVKTKTEGNQVETYYYDAQKRVTKVVFSSLVNPDTYYHEYTYSGASVSEYRSEEPRYELEQTLPNGVTKINCTSNPRVLKLNANGLYAGNASNCESKSFGYDNNQFVTMEDYSIDDYKRTDDIKNDSKNVTRIYAKGFSYGGGEFASTTIFDYYTDKINTIGNTNFGAAYLGKSSENLMKSQTENGVITQYTYEFDAQQRVSKRTAIKENNTIVSSYTYY